MFVLKRANTVCRQPMPTVNLLQKHFKQLSYYAVAKWYYILMQCTGPISGRKSVRGSDASLKSALSQKNYSLLIWIKNVENSTLGWFDLQLAYPSALLSSKGALSCPFRRTILNKQFIYFHNFRLKCF